MVLADLFLAAGNDVVDAGKRLLSFSACTERGDQQGSCRQNHRASNHAPISLNTSPRRKMDPATTTRDDDDHPAAMAAAGEAMTSTPREGAIARASAARASGSAEREFDARVTIIRLTVGSSALSMP